MDFFNYSRNSILLHAYNSRSLARIQSSRLAVIVGIARSLVSPSPPCSPAYIAVHSLSSVSTATFSFLLFEASRYLPPSRFNSHSNVLLPSPWLLELPSRSPLPFSFSLFVDGRKATTERIEVKREKNVRKAQGEERERGREYQREGGG